MDDLRALADAGDWIAGCRLAELLAEQDRTEEAIAVVRALPVGSGTRKLLVRLLLQSGHIEEVRARAYEGDVYARSRLAELFAEQGRVEELRLLAVGRAHTYVARLLARTLAGQDRVDEAVAVMRARVDSGDPDAFDWLVDLLIEQGRVEQAVAALRTRADAYDTDAGYRLASCWRSTDVPTRPSPSCGRAPALPPGWRSCWPHRAVSTRWWPCSTPRRPPVTGTPWSCWSTCWPTRAGSTTCAPARRPATAQPPGGTPTGSSHTAPSTNCAPARTPGT
ncbi:hypothetical protein [Streptomyces sp. NPDC002994]|uniref:tetratricopeptide repeat protein n=1 Tax=Streptomyces sp. NPDC002994 TaxID=3154441 RepID=UPI0033B7354C